MGKKKVLSAIELEQKELAGKLRKLRLVRKRASLLKRIEKHLTDSIIMYPIWISGFDGTFDLTSEEGFKLLEFLKKL